MALTYEDMRLYNRTIDLIVNRCKCINQIGDSLAEVRYARGRYHLDYLGRELATWRLYDVTGADIALKMAETCLNVLWESRRAGLICLA